METDWPKLYRKLGYYARRCVGDRTHISGDDVVQNVIFWLWRTDKLQSCNRYLFQIVSGFVKAASGQGGASEYVECVAMSRKEDWSQVWVDDFLSTLSLSEQLITSLLIHGLNYREIAEDLDLSFQRVGQLVLSIRRKYLIYEGDYEKVYSDHEGRQGTHN